MIRKTERIECKYPEYPKFLDGTHTYKYIGNSTVPEGDLLLTLGEIEDKIQNRKLLEMPCQVGDMVYVVYIKDDEPGYYYDEAFVKEIVIKKDGISIITESAFYMQYEKILSWFYTRNDAIKFIKDKKNK